MLQLLIQPTMGHTHLHRCLSCFISVQGYLKPSALFPISHCKLDYLMRFVWLKYHSILQVVFSELVMNKYDPWSYMIYCGQSYLIIHTLWTKFATVIARLFSYFVISNHPKMVSILTMDVKIRYYLFNLHRMV